MLYRLVEKSFVTNKHEDRNEILELIFHVSLYSYCIHPIHILLLRGSAFIQLDFEAFCQSLCAPQYSCHISSIRDFTLRDVNRSSTGDVFHS